ncbi:MAG: deoxyribodipyrimidine photo-lyase [Dehalococcoidales bacterium]|nr:MAG: deoxyribodipyrimidine photo-lyase [Dehalococcoidales bacterium]
MIEEQRIRHLNKKIPIKGEYILYWMQASQRVEYNHALAYTIEQANKHNLPLFVYFGLTESFPEANERHYAFMLEGLKGTRQKLRDMGIAMLLERTSPEIGVVNKAKKASMVVCDRGYLKIQKQWRNFVAENIDCPLIEVESDVVVPVEIASPKEEYSAATLRRKLIPIIHRYLHEIPEEIPTIDSTNITSIGIDIDNPGSIATDLEIDHTVKPVPDFTGGTDQGKYQLDTFIRNRLETYHDQRNDPNEDAQSNLSPYLHFGQISPLYVALEISEYQGPGVDAFLEELIVRRELSMNYVHYNQDYDSFAGLPDWAQRTLNEHRGDIREYIYTLEEFEHAQTHDPYWNAAQKEMVTTGKMHGYMRMYWGKKILEWTASPEKAFSIAVKLNNKYELDGRDPNGFTGIAWCLGKHDRPWARRPVFGSIRYMSAAGLKRKFDVEKYVRKYQKESD